MNYILDREGYEDLANAIIIRAALDYRLAYKKYRKGDDRAYCRIKEIEKFFNSKWADALTMSKAKEILWRLQKEQEEKTNKQKKTVKISKRENYDVKD